MVPTVGADNAAHLVFLKGKGGVLEGLLHVSTPEKSQVPTLSKGAAVAALSRIRWKDRDDPFLADLVLVGFQFGHGRLGTQSDLFSRSPADRVAAEGGMEWMKRM